MDAIAENLSTYAVNNASDFLSTGTSPTPVSSTNAENILSNEIVKLFEANREKYSGLILQNMENFWNDVNTKQKLDDILNESIGNYMRTNQFVGIVENETKDFIQSLIQKSIRDGLQNPEIYGMICAARTAKVKSVGGIKTHKRKRVKKTQRKRTIKRRN